MWCLNMDNTFKPDPHYGHNGQVKETRHLCRLLALALVAVVTLTACAETQFFVHTAKRVDQAKGTAAGKYKIGNPYQIDGIWYYPRVDYNYDETGIASWYGSKFHGRPTANGEIYDMNRLTAAHRTLPLPSYVTVINLENGRSINVKVNDRGPFARNRIIDLSRRSAQLLGMEKKGTAQVRVKIFTDESRALAARLQGETAVGVGQTPIIIASLPNADVSSEFLPLLPGSPAPAATKAARVTPETVQPQTAAAASPDLGQVKLLPVMATRIFVQAGSFSRFTTANKVRATLSGLGPTKIFPVLVNGKDLFRVRVGPMDSVANADRMLGWVIDAGYADSRIVVD